MSRKGFNPLSVNNNLRKCHLFVFVTSVDDSWQLTSRVSANALCSRVALLPAVLWGLILTIFLKHAVDSDLFWLDHGLFQTKIRTTRESYCCSLGFYHFCVWQFKNCNALFCGLSLSSFLSTSISWHPILPWGCK